MTTNPQPITLEQAMDLADHASPAPWIASQALKAMRAEISRLTAVEPADYQRWVEFNWNRLGFERETNELRELFIMSVGIGGEAGEVQELLKKHVRDGREIRDDLRLELGDVLHYLTRIAAQFGMTLGEIMLANREKIEKRHAARDRAKGATTLPDMGRSRPDAEWPANGDLIRYGHGCTALALHGEPHAGGWHGRQCMGGYTFYTSIARTDEDDVRIWLRHNPRGANTGCEEE